jgi:polysaccharide export outer membrane protein
VKEQHSEPITVIGAVRTPLTLQAVHQMTLLQVLSQAGGITDDAGSKVLITRVRRLPDPATPDPGSPPNDPANNPPNNPAASDPAASSQVVSQGAGTESKDSISIDLNDLLDSGDPKFNIPLYGGDVVTVPHSGVIYAVGAVQRPGGFAMETDRQQLTVLKIVSLAGGLAPTAKPSKAVILRQPPGSAQRLQLPVDVKKIITLKSDDLELQRNDILYVPDSTGKHALRRSAEIAIAIATGAAIIRVE